ncbi:FAD/NAD(P)-binding protein [Pseudomonas siliginis]|jgi:uncharacterized NAD(P)/FAD-binding protein YdhS|uniref:FAD/NAD(P)-binding protein n=1 Tax=Pseudomonas siliginis TaxID=2842346 RepID=UPI002093DB7F|nr:FAD/NAD(P)-binding protein [Pseudomonas siliginis]UST93987.1 FAD/NAD(P)-binding protein [Pseudomonas siliginis]
MKTLVIIGAGFSGTVAAIEFLRSAAEDTRLIIINRSGAVARGLAYGTSSSKHLLNVPAGNMSALVDDPDSFLRYCQVRAPDTTSSSFVSRKLYGDYLATLLEDAEKDFGRPTDVVRICAEVVSLKPQDQGAQIELSSGERILADHVILAFGHFPPRTPAALASLLESPHYIANPWSGSVSAMEQQGESVLLIGSGLTALDVISSLGKVNDGSRIYLLSRRGLLPLSHRANKGGLQAPIPFRDEMLNAAPTILSYLRVLKSQVEAGETLGLNWRDVVAAIRPITSRLWARLPTTERKRFLRHLQPYWDVHRHRVAPQTHEFFADAVKQKKIIPLAGRIRSMETFDGKTLITLQRRGHRDTEQLQIDRIINCTGPNSNPGMIDEPLIQQLIRDGLIAVDDLGLGLLVDDSLCVQCKDGKALSWLSYVGPMLKAGLWEATAVPELRIHASSLARSVSGKFRP